MKKLAYRAAPRAERWLSKKDVEIGRKTLGFEYPAVVHRTTLGSWVGVRFAKRRHELVAAVRGKKRAAIAVPGHVTSRCDVHPSRERVLVVVDPDWNKLMTTALFEIDLDTGQCVVLGYHRGAAKASYCGEDRIAVVSPIGVTLYRRDEDRLVLDGFAKVGGLDVACVRGGKALLVLRRNGWVLVEVRAFSLVAIPGTLEAPDNVNVIAFEREGVVLEDEEGGKLREIVLPVTKAVAPRLNKYLAELATPHRSTKLRLVATEPAAIPKPGKTTPPTLEDKSVAVEAIAAIDATSYAYVSERVLRIRKGKAERERLGLDCYDVVTLLANKKRVVMTLDLLRGEAEQLHRVPGVSTTRLTIADAVDGGGTDQWFLPGYGWRLLARGDRVFVQSGTLAFEVVANR